MALGCSDKATDSAVDTGVGHTEDSGPSSSDDSGSTQPDGSTSTVQPAAPDSNVNPGPPWESLFAPVDGDGDGVTEDMDCNDEDPGTYPEAPEYCDGVDNDCDRTIDGSNALDQSRWYFDEDGDGYGVGPSDLACWSPGDQWVLEGGDCDDTDARIHMDADEICDGVDNDCDGDIDPPSAPDALWYRDQDGDGWGSDAEVVESCTSPGSDWTTLGGDCDDEDTGSHPEAPEWCGGSDNDCSGNDDGIATWVDSSGDMTDATAWLASEGVARYTIMNPGTLKICPGTWMVSLSVRTSTARIEGVGSGVILSGGDTHRVLRATSIVEELEVDNMTLTNGHADRGGAVELSGGTTRFQDVHITNSEATEGYGGGIGIASEASFILEVSNGLFESNTPSDVAGSDWHADVTGDDFSCTAAGCIGDVTTVSE
jgi:hypothetical protein